eukprot:CFRG0134T1
MDPQTMKQYEDVCQSLYSGQSQADPRVQAMLEEFKEPGSAQKCMYLLDNASSPYAHLFAATSLNNMVTQKFTSIDIAQWAQIKSYVLDALYVAKHAAFVRTTLMQVLACLCKHGWYDSTGGTYEFRSVPEEIAKFSQGTAEQKAMGLQAMSVLVNTFNKQGSIRSFTLQRRLASSFRDIALLPMFERCSETLKLCSQKEITVSSTGGEMIIMCVLQLTIDILCFDFIGTASDESVDDSGTVELPSSWKRVVQEYDIVGNLFYLYGDSDTASHLQIRSKSMECLAQMASIKRSMFITADRKMFFTAFITQCIKIMDIKQGLGEEENYHQFCRVLSRIKLVEMSNLVDEELFAKLVTAVGDLLGASVGAWQWSPHSTDYLLSVWAKLVPALPTRTKPSPLPAIFEQYSPRIANDYYSSRIEAVELILRGGLDDPLKDKEALMEQLEKVAVIARYNYEAVWHSLTAIFDKVARRYQELVTDGRAPSDSDTATQIEITHRHLSWIVYITSSIIGQRTGGIGGSTVGNNSDLMDGSLCCNVLQLMRVCDSVSVTSPDLEYAMIVFFKQFSKMYIGSHVQKSTKIFIHLAERLGLNDQMEILEVFVQKIITNLTLWVDTPGLISQTLDLLNELSTGYTTVRLLLKLQSIQYLLANHTQKEFPFLALGHPQFVKIRTTFYTCLSRLMFITIDAGVEDDRFDQFLAPHVAVWRELSELFNAHANNLDVLRANSNARWAVVGLARDLRGIVVASHSKSTYMLVFESVFPDVMHVFRQAVAIWYDEMDITVAVLTFVVEFVQNKNKRIEFDVSSADGILLFRSSSELLSEFTTRMLTLSTPTDDSNNSGLVGVGGISSGGVTGTKKGMKSDKRYKNVTACFNIVRYTLSGKYVNFGVFRLYGDDALDKTFNSFLRIINTVSLAEIMAYPKLSRVFFGLMQVLSEDHMELLSNLDLNLFHYIMSSFLDGLLLPDAKNGVQCCVALDNILTYHLKKKRKPTQPGYQTNKLASLLSQCGDILPRIMEHMLQAIVFEDCQIYWSISRPMLCLILLDEEYFVEMTQKFITSQSMERQETLQKCFSILMQDVDRNLTVKNRDQFTKNVNLFRRDITSHIATPAQSTTSSSNNTMAT